MIRVGSNKSLLAILIVISTNWDQNLPSGAFLTAPEWVKFVELIRLKGQWNGKQIVASEPLA